MLPADLLTLRTLCDTIHRARDPSLLDTHSSRLVPSNNLIASDGGAAFVIPGVTTTGTGCHTSVSAGFGEPETSVCAAEFRWEKTAISTKLNTANAAIFER